MGSEMCIRDSRLFKRALSRAVSLTFFLSSSIATMASHPISDMWNLDTYPRITGYLNNPVNDTIQLKNFIQGQFVEPEQISQWIRSFAPRSGKLLAIVPRTPSNVVEYAVNVAATAFPGWSRTTAQHRSELLFRIASIMEQKRDLFTLWEHIDQGKAIERAHIEVGRSIENFRFVNCSFHFCI